MLWADLLPGDVLHNPEALPDTRSSLLILGIDTLQARSPFAHMVRYLSVGDSVCRFDKHEVHVDDPVRNWILIR